MNKSELIAQVAIGADISIEKAELVVNAFLFHVIHAVASNHDVCLARLGTFSQAVRSARLGRNPATGAIVHIPALWSDKFKAGIVFRRALNSSK